MAYKPNNYYLKKIYENISGSTSSGYRSLRFYLRGIYEGTTDLMKKDEIDTVTVTITYMDATTETKELYVKTEE